MKSLMVKLLDDRGLVAMIVRQKYPLLLLSRGGTTFLCLEKLFAISLLSCWILLILCPGYSISQTVNRLHIKEIQNGAGSKSNFISSWSMLYSNVEDMALKNDAKHLTKVIDPLVLSAEIDKRTSGISHLYKNKNIVSKATGSFQGPVENKTIPNTDRDAIHTPNLKDSLRDIEESSLTSVSKGSPSFTTPYFSQSSLSKSAIPSLSSASGSSLTPSQTRVPQSSPLKTFETSKVVLEAPKSHKAKASIDTTVNQFHSITTSSMSLVRAKTHSSKGQSTKENDPPPLSNQYTEESKSLHLNMNHETQFKSTDPKESPTTRGKNIKFVRRNRRRVRRRSQNPANVSKRTAVSHTHTSHTHTSGRDFDSKLHQKDTSQPVTSTQEEEVSALQTEGQLIQRPKDEGNTHFIHNNQLQLGGMSNHISSILSPMSENDAEFYDIGKDITPPKAAHRQRQTLPSRNFHAGSIEQSDKVIQLDKFTEESSMSSGPWCRTMYDAHAAHHLLRVVCRNVTFDGLPSGLKLEIPDVNTFRLEDSDFPRMMEALTVASHPAKVIHLFMKNSAAENISDVFQIFDASYIITLNLEGNLLCAIDPGVFRDANSLEYLDLSYNNMELLTSDSFSDLPRLKSLNIRFNQLERLPSNMFINNPRLHDLELSKNRIASFHNDTFAGLSELWTLDMSHNMLRSELSRHRQPFSQCSNLKKLVLSHCYINDIRVDTFMGLGHLEFLELFNNELVSIPDGAFKDLAKLTSLNLNNNRLLTISPRLPLPQGLKHLSVYNNSISEISQGTFDGLDLNYIFLDRNKLESLPSKVQLYMASRNVSLGNNPWRCDCDLVSLIHFVQRTHSNSLRGTTCASVATVRHAWKQAARPNYMVDVQISKLQCPAETGCRGRDCELCLRGLQRRVGEHCVCMEGTQPSLRMGSACGVCPQHHFKSTSSNSRCERCSPGSMASLGPASMCACAAGHQNNAKGDCQKCPPGTYKLYEGVGPCSPCPASGSQATNAQAQCETRTLHITSLTQQELENQTSDSPSAAVIALCLVLFGTLLLAAFCFYIYRSKRYAGFRFLRKMKPAQHSPPMVARVTYSSCDSSGLNGGVAVDVCSRQTDFRRTLCIRDVGAVIGRGAFGQVFEASAYLSSQDKETTKVAIKKLKDMASTEEIKNFRLELEQMLNVGPHPNIIGLYGSIMHEGQLCIVMEYAELGDLLTYLRTDVSSPTQYVLVASNGHVIEQTTPEVQENALLMIFAWQICKGMRHLEMHRYIHRDLAARNCLLTRGPVAKVSDFGLSKDAYELGHYKRVQKDRVPFKWLSPEALLWGQYSSKSDVWAFGILLWELYTFGGTPYPQVTTEQLRELHENGYRLSRPPACPEQLYRIMRSCWRDNARQRPSFKQLEYTLDSLIQRTRGREYLELNPHHQHSFLSFTTEDMDDKMTSVDFVRHRKRQATYENQNGDAEHARLNYASLGHDSVDIVATTEMFSSSVNGSESQSQLSSKSTVTSGFQSMCSSHTL